MRCERCGKELTNKIIKINGVTYCEDCARLMGYERFLRGPGELLGTAFAPLDEIASTIMQMNDLDFGNSALSCPKCGTTLRDFENTGRVGCIECYNTFNDYIVKEMFKQQGESAYGGRLPGQAAEIAGVDEAKIEKPANKTEDSSPKASEDRTEEVKEAKAEPAAPAQDSMAKLDQLRKADLGMLSDENLEEGIRLAAASEDYVLASRLRDELKGRKEGN